MKTILLVIDAQAGFCVDGVNSEALERVNTLVSSGIFDCVIASVYQNYACNEIIRFMGWDKLQTAEEQVLLAPVRDHANHVVFKTIYSAYSDSLRALLISENGGQLPDCVFLVGVDTNCCVQETASDLFEAGIRPIVLTDYCASSSGRVVHEAGLVTMASLIGRNNMYAGIIEHKRQLHDALSYAQQTLHQEQIPMEQLAQMVVAQLSKRKWKVSFAESCTGGMIASTLVGVASASSVFENSFVTYSNESKIRHLGVSSETLDTCGAVSEAVALEMAHGAATVGKSQIGVAVSGIAGPTGATPGKPVGMVCFGFWINGDCFSTTKYFGAQGRNHVREMSTRWVFDALLQYLD